MFSILKAYPGALLNLRMGELGYISLSVTNLFIRVIDIF